MTQNTMRYHGNYCCDKMSIFKRQYNKCDVYVAYFVIIFVKAIVVHVEQRNECSSKQDQVANFHVSIKVFYFILIYLYHYEFRRLNVQEVKFTFTFY